MAKWFHIPTFAVHGLLLLSAACTINHYHDFFLISSAILLMGYLIYCARTVWKRNNPLAILVSYGLGVLVQFFAFHTGLINVHSGAFGLGGGEFALFFYEIALGISCVIVLLISLITALIKK